MLEVVRVRIQRAEEVFVMVKRSRFGIGPNTALSIDRDFDPLENVNDLCSAVVKMYLARRLFRAIL
jgi:hypothetical protein